MSKRKFEVRKILLVAVIFAFTIQMATIKSFAGNPNESNSEHQEKKTIAILTSGGDAPGMNAIVRAVTRAAIESGMKVLGIRHGYTGLLEKNVVELSLRSVSGIIRMGGTFLFTARSEAFNSSEGVALAVKNCKELGISGIIVAGGDGSFRGARDLSNQGIPCIGIPATIDNDICCSDYTVGFDTAVNTAVSMVDKIKDTTESHDRCSVVEVMGRHCGDIALHTGIAVGATAIVIPEKPFDFQRDIIEKISETKKTGKNHFVILVAEGVGGAQDLATAIQKTTAIESRATILGYVVRGGSPSAKDRIIASQMGVHAVDLLKQSKGNRVVVMRDGKVIDLDITQALDMKKAFDESLYSAAMRISI